MGATELRAPEPSTVAASHYLTELADLLPAREARRVRDDVSAMILDRADALRDADPNMDAETAELRALDALGTPAQLAEQLAEHPVRVPWATVRAFQRTLWIVVPCHLLLAILMTVAGADGRAAGGMMGPIPAAPWPATLMAILKIALVDVGALTVLYWFLRRRSSDWRGARTPLRITSKQETISSLVLIALLAVIVNGLVPRIFAVDVGGATQTFLSGPVLALLPYCNLILAAFAGRDLFRLFRHGGARAPVLLDAAASLGGGALMLVAASRPSLVEMPELPLGAATSGALGELLTRVFLLLLLVGALAAVARGFRLLWHLPRIAPE